MIPVDEMVIPPPEPQRSGILGITEERVITPPETDAVDVLDNKEESQVTPAEVEPLGDLLEMTDDLGADCCSGAEFDDFECDFC
jgi:hypothetical protein